MYGKKKGAGNAGIRFVERVVTAMNYLKAYHERYHTLKDSRLLRPMHRPGSDIDIQRMPHPLTHPAFRETIHHQ